MLFAFGFLLFAVLVAVVVFYFLRKTGVKKELYESEVIYADNAEKPKKPFFSQRYLLAGIPDLILKTAHGNVPVEKKSTFPPQEPYESHVMQLMAYCLLLEENGSKPDFGYLQYRDAEPVKIMYTEYQKQKLLNIMGEMRKFIETKKIKSVNSSVFSQSE
ncbi:MAG: hypothetical protein COV47_03960 [Candidatus Diapherotrites archaeon CG11_big_fil_rev_8_21_14_0_20_37_9]|nr:MAG: hypothetical protein COV47_03960 [Candidatus Diapherotrites archaeon CG11_big_fil_rev_8_21_14_0_20_37_9]